jgi:hypothetical protein
MDSDEPFELARNSLYSISVGLQHIVTWGGVPYQLIEPSGHRSPLKKAGLSGKTVSLIEKGYCAKILRDVMSGASSKMNKVAFDGSLNEISKLMVAHTPWFGCASGTSQCILSIWILCCASVARIKCTCPQVTANGQEEWNRLEQARLVETGDILLDNVLPIGCGDDFGDSYGKREQIAGAQQTHPAVRLCSKRV